MTDDVHKRRKVIAVGARGPDRMASEYDFSGAVPNPFAAELVNEIVVKLDPELAAAFPTADAIRAALRSSLRQRRGAVPRTALIQSRAAKRVAPERVRTLDELVKARSSYDYPSVGLRAADGLREPATWATDLLEHRFPNTLELDLHHHRLLHADDDHAVVTGLMSVVYWGYYTSKGLAPARCSWLAIGKRGSPGMSLADMGVTRAASIVRAATELLAQGDVEGAMIAVRALPYMGTSFGSKLLAFLDPEHVGVLDDKITRHMELGTFGAVLGEDQVGGLVGLRGESAAKAAKRFARFCAALAEVTQAVNDLGVGWRDTSGAMMTRFRAVDVERAMFVLALTADR